MYKWTGNVIAVILLAVIILIFCLPLLENISYIAGEIDWLQLASIQLLLKDSVLEYAQFPFHTPFLGGGYPLYAHPQSDSLNPFFIFTLIFNEWIGFKLRILFYYLIGGIGMFFLVRNGLKYSLMGSLFSACLITMNSYYPFHIVTGNLDVGLYYYLPLIILFLIKSRDKKIYLFFEILLWAHLLLGANGLFIHVMALFSFFFCFTYLFKENGVKISIGLVKNLIISIVAGIMLAAVRVIPMAELLYKVGPRFTDYREAITGSLSFNNLYHSLFTAGPFRDLPPLSQDTFPDGAYADSVMYFGYIILALVIISSIVYWRKVIGFVILIIIFIILIMGNHSPLDLFYYLWHLPIFNSMHMPNKYFAFPIIFLLSIIPGQLFPKKVSTGKGRILLSCLIMAALFSLFRMWTVSNSYLVDIFSYPPATELKGEKPFFQVLGFANYIRSDHEKFLQLYYPGIDLSYNGAVLDIEMDRGEGVKKYPSIVQRYNANQYYFIREDIGSIIWYGWLYLPESASPKYFIELSTGDSYFNPDYRGEYYFAGEENKVELVEFSPNSYEFSVVVKKPDTLILNLNYDKSWGTDIGEAADIEGLQGVYLKSVGSYSINLRYVPANFYIGLAISIVTLLSLLGGWIYLKKKHEKNDP